MKINELTNRVGRVKYPTHLDVTEQLSVARDARVNTHPQHLWITLESCRHARYNGYLLKSRLHLPVDYQ